MEVLAFRAVVVGLGAEGRRIRTGVLGVGILFEDLGLFFQRELLLWDMAEGVWKFEDLALTMRCL